MFRTALRRLREREEGFTLIELMVVVMILGILMVMGLPTFFAVVSRFQDRAAQTELRTAVIAARVVYTDNASFASANPAQLEQVEPSICYGLATTPSVSSGAPAATCPSGQEATISVSGSAMTFGAARMADSGKCFLIADSTAGTFYGVTVTPAQCTAQYGVSGVLTATTPASGGW